MQSKMTERAFVEKVTYPYGRGGIGVSPEVVQHVVCCAREAGLEFAPEPLPVARELEDSGGWATFSGFHAWERSPQGNAPFDVSETYALGILRYNAYPGLREKAEALVRSISGGNNGWSKIKQAATELEVELAKGPK